MVSTEQARFLLGVKADASPADVRRAFRAKALQFHPDKNLADPAGAAEQFQRLTRAYQRLSNGAAGGGDGSDEADGDVDVMDILTEDFLRDCCALDLSPFDQMLLQQASQRATRRREQSTRGAEGSPKAGATPTADDDEAVWRMLRDIATARRRRRRRGKQQQPDEKGTSPGTSHPTGPGSSWMMLWEFLSDLILPPHQGSAASGVDGALVVTSKLPTHVQLPQAWRWGQPQSSAGLGGNEGRGSSPEGQPGVLMLTDSRQAREERRRSNGAVWRQRAEVVRGARYSPPEGTQQNQQDQGTEGQTQQPESGQEIRRLVVINSSTPLEAEIDEVATSSSIGRGRGRGHHRRRPRWLTLHNCWLWTKRVLLVKALLMLVRY